MSKISGQEVDKVCANSSNAKACPDKANLHRLLELYHHKLPMFGRVREFMELIFESTHQTLKRSMARSNHRDSQLFALENFLANDWQARLSSLYNDLRNENQTNIVLARRGLRLLIVGLQYETLQEDSNSDLLKEMDAELLQIFSEPVVKLLNDRSMVAHFHRVGWSRD